MVREIEALRIVSFCLELHASGAYINYEAWGGDVAIARMDY